jgi:hypothetical protein
MDAENALKNLRIQRSSASYLFLKKLTRRNLNFGVSYVHFYIFFTGNCISLTVFESF